MALFHVRRTLASSLLRALSSASASSSSTIASRSPLAFAILTKETPVLPLSLKFPIRFQTSVADESPVNDSPTDSVKTTPKDTDSTKSSQKEEVILAGCDLEHWLIIMDFPDPKPSEAEMVNTYVKTLAEVVGSEEEAKKKIYSVGTTPYTGFGALISQELSAKVKGLPGVLWVLPDSYMDVPNKDYGGDLFIDGKVIPRSKYRYTQKQSDNNNPQQNDRRDERRRPNQRPNQRPNRGRAY